MNLKKVLFNLFLIFVLFNNVIFNLLPLPEIFNYWDEIIEIIIICMGLLLLKNKSQREYYVLFLILFFIASLGIFGNLYFNYVPLNNYVVKDIIAFFKFPITLLILKSYNFDEICEKYISRTFIIFVKFMILTMFFSGIFSLFLDLGMSQNEIRNGIRPFQFFFSHPTYLVLNSLFLLLLFDSDFMSCKNNFLYRFMLIVILILTMRTKGIVIAALYMFMKYFGATLKKVKIFYWIGSFFVIYFSSIKKIALYASYSSSPREALYRGGILLANKSFPIGSGFATFASHISAKSNSKVYEFIKIPYYWVENGNQYAVLGDAGLAYYIGQFGYVGFILFMYFLVRLYKLTTCNLKNKFPVQILWLYVIVALTSESILINNGIELCFMFLFLSCLNLKKDGEMDEKNIDNC